MKRSLSPGGLSFIQAGEGPPVLFAHGWTMAATVWQRQLDYLALRGLQPIAIDLRGHGSSIKEGPFTISEMAYDLKRFIHEMGYDRPFLVGWSMGAMVILDYLVTHPHSASGFCLVGGTPRFTSSDDYPYGLKPDDVRGMKAKLKRDFERCLRDFREGISGELMPEEKNLITGAALPSFDAAKEGLHELMTVDLRNSIEKVRLPGLLIHGSNDRVCPAGAARYMADRLEGSQLLLLDGAGHVPFLSHEEQFNEALEKFIRRHIDLD